jgi:hypothetical protein
VCPKDVSTFSSIILAHCSLKAVFDISYYSINEQTICADSIVSSMRKEMS